MSSGTLFLVALVRTDVSENIPPASVIDTAVKAPQKTVFIDPTRYPPMERVINSDSTVTQLWNPVTLRNPKDGGSMFFETSVLTGATRYKVPEDLYH
jgi:hypothetical protein